MPLKIKVLIYSDCYLYGGSEKIVLNIIRNSIIQESTQITFAYRKHKLYQRSIAKDYSKREQAEILFPISILSNDTIFYHLYLRNIPGFLKKLITIPFVIFSRLGIYFLYNLIVQIIALKKQKPDIVHINNGGYPAAYSCNTMVVASKICRIKKVIYQVNNLTEIRKGLIDKIFDNFIERNVSFFITASSGAREKLALERKFDLSKIKRIPNTISEELITSSRQEIIEELKFKQTDFILCNVALLSKRKGQQYLLDAISIIKNNFPSTFKEIQLIIIGNGEEEKRLKDYSDYLGISSKVSFMGYRSDSINFINACDVYILPSIASEDMPLVILSAMSKGKPIIATDFAGISEEIENGKSGLLIPLNTSTLATDIANAINEMFTNRNHQYGRNAQNRFNKLFSNESYGRNLLEIYKL